MNHGSITVSIVSRTIQSSEIGEVEKISINKLKLAKKEKETSMSWSNMIANK